MDHLFDRLFWCTDQHFGRRSNSPSDNQDNLAFFDWAIDNARSWGAETCILGGDLFDNRHSLGVLTINAALHALDEISAAFKNIYVLVGNHDLPYRERREGASVEFGRNYPNIHIIREPTTLGEVALLPWLVGNEHKNIKSLRGRYVFGHLELPGFLMNARITMPDSPDAAHAEDFNAEYVMSGHFHARQQKRAGNSIIVYTGSIMPFNFTDEGDDDRGMMLLEWGHDPIFRVWPSQPTYRSVKLSYLLENLNSLKQGMTLKVAVDVPLLFEEAQEMRETLISGYALRKVELNHARDEIDQTTFEPDAALHTVDQLVVEGLRSIDSTGLSKDRLIEIYTSL